MMYYAIAIVLVHAVLAVHAGNPFQKTRPASDIEALCADKPVALLALPELEHLNTIVSGSACSDQVKLAIPDLLALINETKGDLCALESINKLRDFYSKYLDTSRAATDKKREQLPTSLRKFALAYGMQMSSYCKRHMVDVLIKNNYVLAGDRRKSIRDLVSSKSPVADMLEGLAGPDELLLPSDLAPYMKDTKQDEDGVIFVQSATGPYIRQMQVNCVQVFAPIYKPLIRSVVRLANMGFNYRDEPLRCDMGCTKTSMLLARWSRLIFLCESLNGIHLIDVPREQSSPTDPVRILTKEEAAALEGKTVSDLLPKVSEQKQEPVSLQVDALIFNETDRKLKKAIKAFSTSKSEDEKIAKRMMGKGVSMFKTQLKRLNIGVLFSAGSKALVHRIRTGENLRPSDEIIKVLDGAIGHESEFQDGLDPIDLGMNWESAKVIANEIGAKLAPAVMGIVIVAIVLFCIGVVVINGFLLFG